MHLLVSSGHSPCFLISSSSNPPPPQLSGYLCIEECSGGGCGEGEGASDGDSIRRNTASWTCGGHGRHQRTLQQTQNVDACSRVRESWGEMGWEDVCVCGGGGGKG